MSEWKDSVIVNGVKYNVYVHRSRIQKYVYKEEKADRTKGKRSWDFMLISEPPRLFLPSFLPLSL